MKKRQVESPFPVDVDGIGYSIDRYGVVHQQPPYEDFAYDVKYLEDRYLPIPEKVSEISHLRAGLLAGITAPRAGDAILDCGYGMGGFLRVVNAMGFKACGVEKIDYPVPEGCFRVSDAEMRYCHWHCVTFFDSVEHMIPHFLSILNTSFVMISAPFCHEAPASEWFRTWKHRRPNEHLYHFNPDSLKLMLHDSGFREIWRGSPEDVIRSAKNGRANTFTSVFIREDLAE